MCADISVNLDETPISKASTVGAEARIVSRLVTASLRGISRYVYVHVSGSRVRSALECAWLTSSKLVPRDAGIRYRPRARRTLVNAPGETSRSSSCTYLVRGSAVPVSAPCIRIIAIAPITARSYRRTRIRASFDDGDADFSAARFSA